MTELVVALDEVYVVYKTFFFVENTDVQTCDPAFGVVTVPLQTPPVFCENSAFSVNTPRWVAITSCFRLFQSVLVVFSETDEADVETIDDVPRKTVFREVDAVNRESALAAVGETSANVAKTINVETNADIFFKRNPPKI